MSNTLITGGSGLLGQHLECGLKPSKKELDITDYNQLYSYIKANNVTKIIHGAAKVGGVKSNSLYPYDYFIENATMNLNIIKACKECNIKNVVLLLSTCIFPESAPLPLSEDSLHCGEPHSSNFAYAYSKRMLEIGSRALQKQFLVKPTCLIPCNLYGENDNYDVENGHVIPSLIHKCYKAKMANEPFIIWGSGNAEREFMYAGDLAKIITQISCNDVQVETPMIVSPDNIFTIREVVELIIKHMKFTGKVIFDTSKPEGIMKKNTLNDTFKKHFPYFSFTDLDVGLQKSIEYFNTNYSTIRK